MYYFIISGIKNAGKTTCVCNLYNYLISKGYMDVVPPIKKIMILLAYFPINNNSY